MTPRRTGFTLVELLVAITLLALVGVTLSKVVTRQQKFYSGVADVMDQRSQLRQALGVITRDLRQASSAGGDIVALSDSAVDFQTLVGTGIICALSNGNKTVDMPPKALYSGQTLSSLVTNPRAGDIVYAYDDSTDTGNALDVWQQDTVTSYAPTSATCTASPYVDATNDAGKERVRLNLTGALSPYVAIGNPVRIMRRMRYKLYQAQNGKWYLGYADWNGASWGTMEPVSGPYMSYVQGTTAQSGLTFRYYDSTGVEITTSANASKVARVDLVARAQTTNKSRVSGLQKGGYYTDSLTTKIALRNRS